MLKFYNIYYTTYHNGTDVGTKSAQILCDESEVDEWHPSIATILEWHDGEKAIQYLNERNLRIGVDK